MPDKHIVTVFLIGTGLLVLLLLFIIAYLIIHKQRASAHVLERSRLKYEYEHRLYETRLREQERVMTHISREIHDNVGQSLSFLKMSLNVISKYMTPDTPADLLNNTHKVLDQIINDTHNMSHGLNSAHIKRHGLFAILKMELDHLQASRNIHCRLAVTGASKIDNPEMELVIYRIAQEAVHNVIKHAKATELTVRLDYGQPFTMEIEDNGIGFNTTDEHVPGGIGLQNMRERAAFLKGSLQIFSVPDQGSFVRLTI